LNTPGDEYAPRMESQGLLYSRSPIVGDSDVELRTELMYSAFRQNGLQEGRKFSEELSSPLHESSACLGPNSNFVIFSCNSSAKRTTTNYLYLSKVGVHDFQAAEELPFNDPRYNTTHPTLDHSGKRLLFSSDRPGGYGGFDLYYAEFKDGVWSSAINLGGAVNTKSDEFFPYWGENELITFSSNRPGGLGGTDLYLLDASNAGWKRVSHIGEPFSSEADDHGLTWSLAQGKGFLASNREGGKGGDDIYSFTFSENSPISWLPVGAAKDKLVVLNQERELVARLDDRDVWHGDLATYPSLEGSDYRASKHRFCGSFSQGAPGAPDSIMSNGIRVELKRSDILQPLEGVSLKNADADDYQTNMIGGTCLPSTSNAQKWIIEKQGFNSQTIEFDPSIPYVEVQLEASKPVDSLTLRSILVTDRRISGSLHDEVINSLSSIGALSGYQVVNLDVKLLSSQTSTSARAEAENLSKVFSKELTLHPKAKVKSSGLSLFSDAGQREKARIGLTAEALVEYEILLKKIPAGNGIGLNID